MTIDPRIYDIARTNLTRGQFLAWDWHIHGESQRAIAYRLDISRTTVSDRLDAAWRILRKHGVMVTPDGQPYLATEVEA
jgi:DNA-binding transcriptional regulator LsrR (DeoR family)